MLIYNTESTVLHASKNKRLEVAYILAGFTVIIMQSHPSAVFPALSPLRPQQKESRRFFLRDLATKVQKQSNSPILSLNLATKVNESSAIPVYVLGSPPFPPPQ